MTETATPAAARPKPSGAWDRAAALVLTFGTGATDAFAFIALGGVFTANMTGNLVLMGLVGRSGYLLTLFGTVLAVVVFAVSVWVSAWMTAPGRRAARSVTGRRVLWGSVGAQALTLLLWLTHAAAPADATADQVTLFTTLAVSAWAMGAQTVAARALELPSSVTTTYVTGTLVTTITDAVQHRRSPSVFKVAEIGMLPCGALAGAVVMMQMQVIGPVLPLVASAGAAFLIGLGRRRCHGAPGGSKE